MAKQPPRVTLDTPLGADVDLDAEEVRTQTGHRLTEQDVAELVDDARAKADRPSVNRDA